MDRIKRVLSLIFQNIYVFRVDYIRVLLLSKMMELLVLLPVISFLFYMMLELLQIQAVTEQNISLLLNNPLFWFVGIIIILLVLVFIYYEMGFYMLLAYYQQRQIPYTLSTIWRRLNKKVLYFLSFESLLFVLYFLLFVPLVTTVLPLSIFQHIDIPAFIVDELLLSTEGKLLYYAAIILLFFISLRLIFTLPFFIINHWMGVFSAIKESLKFSNKKTVETAGMLVFIAAVYASIVAVLLAVAFLPLFVIERMAPSYGHVTAAFTLTAVQGIIFVAFGLLQAMFSQVLVFVAYKLTKQRPVNSYPKLFQRKVLQWSVILSIFAFFLWSGINYLNIAKTIYEPDTQIIAHRGFIEKGVENTISSLIASAEAGADMVEIDIQQTKDGEFVVFHDKTLSRLAGRNAAVHTLTLQQITEITVRNNGLSDQIPSLDAMLEESKRLNVKLLIEIKPHGYETDDFLQLLIDKLTTHQALDIHYVQSLDFNLAVELKELEPRLHVGSVHAVALGTIPKLPFDFIAVEQSFVGQALIEQAKKAKIALFVWTVNSDSKLQRYFIENAGGVITNHPDRAFQLREDLEQEKYFIRRILNKIELIF